MRTPVSCSHVNREKQKLEWLCPSLDAAAHRLKVFMMPQDSILVWDHQWCVNEIILENGGKKMSVYQNVICKQGVILSLPQPTHALE